ncbi:DUF998 domain-containing protein [Actinomadura kijaniata]|uniref:DUF998 domain-containing protein n=1 Tax=Actinomadura kijaniata TaxID=46161 RepID=UPI00082EE810|nr:DUF998 domain-containing protein [Actinomadura kijaniata]
MNASTWPRVALRCGVLAGPLFTLAHLLEAFTRDAYDPLRHPVSSLALGPHGWMQTLNFLVTGSLTLLFAFGIRRASGPVGGSFWGPLLVGVWGVGLLGAGIFLTDPVNGYPPGSPDLLPSPTVHGVWHDGLSLMGFVSLVVACFVFAGRFARAGAPGWAWGSVLCGVGFAVLMELANVGFVQDGGLENVAGLFQRLAATLGLAWQALLGLYLLRHRPEPRSARVLPDGRGSARSE